jgi:hypothetical protein
LTRFHGVSTTDTRKKSAGIRVEAEAGGAMRSGAERYKKPPLDCSEQSESESDDIFGRFSSDDEEELQQHLSSHIKGRRGRGSFGSGGDGGTDSAENSEADDNDDIDSDHCRGGSDSDDAGSSFLLGGRRKNHKNLKKKVHGGECDGVDDDEEEEEEEEEEDVFDRDEYEVR